METYVALLRGINVSGKNLIKMAELVQVLSEAGVSKVKTYIQSGNVVFESGSDNPVNIENLIRDKIRERFQLEVPVQVVKRSELLIISNQNPFINDRALPADKLHITLLNAIPDPKLVGKIVAENFLPDEFVVSGRTVYLYCLDGYGRTKLTNTFFEKKLMVSATTRNWSTVKKLCEM